MPELNFDGRPGCNNKVCGHEPVVKLRSNRTGEIYYKSFKAETSTVEQIRTVKVLSITIQEEIFTRTILNSLATEFKHPKGPERISRYYA
jgi:hypothetical protein